MRIKRGHTVLMTGGVDFLHGSAGWNGARQTDGSVRQTHVSRVNASCIEIVQIFTCERF